MFHLQLTFPPWNPGPVKTIYLGPPPVHSTATNTTVTTTPTTTTAMETEKIFKSSVGGGDIDDKVIGECSVHFIYSNTCLKRHLSKRPKISFQDQISLNAGQKFAECSKRSILQYFVKLPFVFKTFVLSIFEWPHKTGLL